MQCDDVPDAGGTLFRCPKRRRISGMLRAVRVENYRCFAKAALEDCGALVILIGENDSGKSSILDAVEIASDMRKPSPTDLRRYPAGDPRQGEPLRIELEIALPPGAGIPKKYTRGKKGTELCLRRTITASLSSTYEVFGAHYDDPVFDAFPKASAQEQKEALQRAGETPLANATLRIEQVEALEAAGQLKWSEGWIAVAYADVREFMPAISKIAAADYDDPVAEVQRIVSERVRKQLVVLEAEVPEVFSKAAEVARAGADAAVAEIKPHLQAVFPHLVEVRSSCGADFKRPLVRASIDIDLGQGFKPLGEMGQGTRRRAWMALQHGQWQVETKPCLRMYDEPDANLHYEAQRSLYRAIKAISASSQSTQLFLCTHAVTLIDSVAPRDIRILRCDAVVGHTIDSLLARGVDSSALDAIAAVGRGVGLGNIVLLYERAFLLVEGETEFGALPILYNKLFGANHEEHGIRIVNLETCGAWRSVVKVLLKARSGITVMMLDQDCANAESSAKLNQQSLGELGIDPNCVFLVGKKEFEDAFPDDAWLRVMARFPRQDGRQWGAADLQAVRARDKFSDAIVRLLRADADPQLRSGATKPELGRILAEVVSDIEIPALVVDAMKRLRAIANC